MTKEEFYKKLDELFLVSNYRIPIPYRRRWGQRSPGNGRYADRGIVRWFSEDVIHASLYNPLINGVFTSKKLIEKIMSEDNYMTVGKLIETLKEFDPSLRVYSSVDEEGNYFNRMYFDPEIRYVPNDEESENGSEICSREEDVIESIMENEDLLEEEEAREFLEADYIKVVLV